MTTLIIGNTKYHHPEFLTYGDEWQKWRLTFEGGRSFINTYLKRHSTRESSEDFELRKEATYCPWHAGAAITKVKNSIYQRMPDITRVSTSQTYIRSISGLDGGVDSVGSTMNYFLGCEILPELLVMGKVGVYVDMPAIDSMSTSYNTQNLKPYLYKYTREQIVNWSKDNYGKLTALVLHDVGYEYDKETGFPVGYVDKYRYLRLTPEGVVVTILDDRCEPLEQPILLGIKTIPFVIFELNESLLKNIADYQIAMLNIESSDIAYIQKSNFTFYVEQFDPNVEAMLANMKRATSDVAGVDGTNDQANTAEDNTINIGIAKGRRYPKGIEAPKFLSPSTEPLKASMEKQEAMKADILKLLNLSLASIKNNRSSADSKKQDQTDEECGLSYIGLELESGERQIISIWQQYENNDKEFNIKYPETYEIHTFEQSLNIAGKLADLIPFMPSNAGRKVMASMLAHNVLGGRVSTEELEKIKIDINAAKAIVSDPSVISEDAKDGLCSIGLASVLKGYPDGEAERAKEEHAERLALIAAYQSKGGLNNAGARGVDDLSTDSEDSKIEKIGKKGRGEAK